ncbi:MAG TPA: hypothetical protein VFE64_12525 [Devosia sp.]|jgi:hypothetical protein|nr:hypothetical protein [Devosia sp.]
MKTVALILVSAGIALPFTAFAQSSDVDYCNKLSATYRSVVMGNATPQAQIPEAMSKCSSSPATSIPVLEKALTDNKVTLPSR